MTIESNVNKQSFIGDGVTRSFVFQEDVLVEDGIGVLLFNDTSKETQYLVRNVDYQVFIEDRVCTVLLLAVTPTPEAGTRLIMYRTEPVEQTLDYVIGGDFPANSTENALDKIILGMQSLHEQVKRSVKLPEALLNKDANGFFDGRSSFPDESSYLFFDNDLKKIVFNGGTGGADGIAGADGVDGVDGVDGYDTGGNLVIDVPVSYSIGDIIGVENIDGVPTVVDAMTESENDFFLATAFVLGNAPVGRVTAPFYVAESPHPLNTVGQDVLLNDIKIGIVVAEDKHILLPADIVESPNVFDWYTHDIEGATEGVDFADIAFGDGVFLAIDESTPPIIAATSDGRTFNPRGVLDGGISGSQQASIAYGNRVWITTSGSLLNVSQNNGCSWASVPLTEDGASVTFGGGAFLVFGATELYRTTDGVSFTTTLHGMDGVLTLGCEYFNGAFIVTRELKTYRSTNNGATWLEIARDGDSFSHSYSVQNLLEGGVDTVRRSTDMGVTWSEDTITDGATGDVYLGVGDGVHVFSTNTGTEDDGGVWTLCDGNWVKHPIDGGWRAVAYGNKIFVGVSTIGKLDARALTNVAPFGVGGSESSGVIPPFVIGWYNHPIPNPTVTPGFRSVLFADGKIFLAGHNSVIEASFSTSLDGVTFTTVVPSVLDDSSPPVPVDFQTLNSHMAYGNGRLVLLFNTYTYVSTNGGDNWVRTSVSSTTQMEGLAFGNGVFVTKKGSGRNLFRSTDGSSWTSSGAVPLTVSGSSYGSGFVYFFFNRFVILTMDNVVTSPDGVIWQTVFHDADINPGVVAAFDGKMIICQNNDGKIILSFDLGKTWHTVAQDIGMVSQFTYGGGVFIASVDNPSPVLWSSENGVTWTQLTAAYGASRMDFGYVNGKGVFVGAHSTQNFNLTNVPPL